jgi:hypothetical protein
MKVLKAREKQITKFSEEFKVLRGQFLAGNVSVDKIDDIVADLTEKYQLIFGSDTAVKPTLFVKDTPERMSKDHADKIGGTSDAEGNVFDTDGTKLGHYEDKKFVPEDSSARDTPEPTTASIVTETATGVGTDHRGNPISAEETKVTTEPDNGVILEGEKPQPYPGDDKVVDGGVYTHPTSKQTLYAKANPNTGKIELHTKP